MVSRSDRRSNHDADFIVAKNLTADLPPTTATCTRRQHRNPFPTPPHVDAVDLPPLQCTCELALLLAQNAGENQPWHLLYFRQNRNQQLARQIRCHIADSARQL